MDVQCVVQHDHPYVLVRTITILISAKGLIKAASLVRYETEKGAMVSKRHGILSFLG